MVYRGRVKNGVVVLEDGVRLAEGTEVEVGGTAPVTEQPAETPTLAERLKNVEHYLYGMPKR